jgi:hypothetical protein
MQKARRKAHLDTPATFVALQARIGREAAGASISRVHNTFESSHKRDELALTLRANCGLMHATNSIFISVIGNGKQPRAAR